MYSVFHCNIIAEYPISYSALLMYLHVYHTMTV